MAISSPVSAFFSNQSSRTSFASSLLCTGFVRILPREVAHAQELSIMSLGRCKMHTENVFNVYINWKFYFGKLRARGLSYPMDSARYFLVTHFPRPPFAEVLVLHFFTCSSTSWRERPCCNSCRIFSPQNWTAPQKHHRDEGKVQVNQAFIVAI